MGGFARRGGGARPIWRSRTNRVGSTSTFEGLGGGVSAKQDRVGRHVGTGLLALVIVVALTGVFGPRKATASAHEAGYTMSLTYGSVVRSGQPVPMSLTITAGGGFTGPVTVAFDRDMFERFDFQNWYPNPDHETGNRSSVTYRFTPPSGDTLKIVLDARVAPLQIGGHFSYWVSLMDAGRQIAPIDYSIWVMP